MPERLGHAADLGGHDRQATCERLGDDHPVRLRARREHQHVRRDVAAREIGSGLRTRETHSVLHPAVADPTAQTRRECRFALQAADAQTLPTQTRQHLERVDQHVVALAANDRGHREQTEQRTVQGIPVRPGGGTPEELVVHAEQQ